MALKEEIIGAFGATHNTWAKREKMGHKLQ